MIEISKIETYSQWFKSLGDRRAKSRIDIRVRRLSMDNPRNVKPV